MKSISDNRFVFYNRHRQKDDGDVKKFTRGELITVIILGILFGGGFLLLGITLIKVGYEGIIHTINNWSQTPDFKNLSKYSLAISFGGLALSLPLMLVATMKLRRVTTHKKCWIDIKAPRGKPRGIAYLIKTHKL